MKASDQFQGLCLQSFDGYRYMEHIYDYMPPDVRRRLRSSSYNLCAACVEETARAIAGYEYGIHSGHYLLAIQQMESAIRAGQY